MMNFYLKGLERLKINFWFTIYRASIYSNEFFSKYAYEMTKWFINCESYDGAACYILAVVGSSDITRLGV